MKLPVQQANALDRSISATRMGTYLRAASGNMEAARQLYLWDRDLSVAILGDLAILEVALRNTMSDQLETKWGAEWYSNPEMPLDERSSKELNRAWSRASEPRLPGKVIAQCMFGFWRGLLDKGDHVGLAPRRNRCDYEQLWRGVLDRAFPGGRAQARKDGRRWNREYARSVVSIVNDLRNRVAHHEPLVNGLPLSGQQVRLTAAEAHMATMKLAAMIDRDLHAFLTTRTQVPAILAKRPLRVP